MNTANDILERYEWWTSLKHGGLLIAPGRLAEYFPEQPPPLHSHEVDRLRRAVVDADRAYLWSSASR